MFTASNKRNSFRSILVNSFGADCPGCVLLLVVDGGMVHGVLDFSWCNCFVSLENFLGSF